MKKKYKVRKVKPVLDNGKAHSPLQFNVVKDNKRDKIVKAKDVFEYKKKK
tara:strand:- start:57 stop:206 length:150 start_codon:yes stop_codon:yes gene_type:complete